MLPSLGREIERKMQVLGSQTTSSQSLKEPGKGPEMAGVSPGPEMQENPKIPGVQQEHPGERLGPAGFPGAHPIPNAHLADIADQGRSERQGQKVDPSLEFLAAGRTPKL